MLCTLRNCIDTYIVIIQYNITMYLIITQYLQVTTSYQKTKIVFYYAENLIIIIIIIVHIHRLTAK